MFVPKLTVLILKVDKVLLSTAHAVPTDNYKRTTAPVWGTAVPGWGLATHHSQLYLEWRVRKLTVVSPTSAQSTYKTSSCCVYARTSIWWTLVSRVVLWTVKVIRRGFLAHFQTENYSADVVVPPFQRTEQNISLHSRVSNKGLRFQMGQS